MVVKKWSGVGEPGECIRPPVDAMSLFHLGLDCVVGGGEGVRQRRGQYVSVSLPVPVGQKRHCERVSHSAGMYLGGEGEGEGELE